MKSFLKVAAVGLVLVVVIAAIAGGGKNSSGSGSTSAGTTSTAATSTAASKPKHHRGNPCAHIRRSAVTSCPFALAVKKAYLVHPSGTVVAYSPVTHKTYTMHCLQSEGVAACSGGTGSEVAFKGPPGPGTSAPITTGSTTPPPAPAATTQQVEQPGSRPAATLLTTSSALRTAASRTSPTAMAPSSNARTVNGATQGVSRAPAPIMGARPTVPIGAARRAPEGASERFGRNEADPPPRPRVAPVCLSLPPPATLQARGGQPASPAHPLAGGSLLLYSDTRQEPVEPVDDIVHVALHQRRYAADLPTEQSLV